MRKALNENPRVQLAVLGVGGILLAIMLMTSMGGGGGAEPEPATDPATSSATASGAAPATDTATEDPAATDPAATATPAPATSTPAPAPTDTGTSGTVPATPPSGSGSSEGLLASEGLPKDVLIAYAKNMAIALLVIDPKGISDNRVKKFTKALQARGDVEVFVVKAGKIANYARITEGVSVTRTPSLVVIRPRDKSNDVPTAIVSEGFRSAKSVQTALEDALYTGGGRPSHPG